ncbi:hypothetical protein GN316_11170 [Xylophilus sp. Kf1]|nr:hypothetical protein [Xylophilus sp. Kf1]
MPTLPEPSSPAPHRPCAHFDDGTAMRSRSVGDRVLHATLNLPALPPRLAADCRREMDERLDLAIGDVEPLSWPRARSRWPDYRRWEEALDGWAMDTGLQSAFVDADLALMACRGAPFHHDADAYAGAAFCNLFLSEDRGLDVVFPLAGRRIPLGRGTVLLFDTCQPHAVLPRGCRQFDPADFGADRDWSQLFLTWELPIDAAPVARALGIAFDIDRAGASTAPQNQLWLDGAPLRLCAETGRIGRPGEAEGIR